MTISLSPFYLADMGRALEPEIVVIPEGLFWMGSDRGQENEQPRHRVWVDGFGLGKFPVINREYSIYVDETGAAPAPFRSEPMFTGADQPVVGVSWTEAVNYCHWLSERTGRFFRLPTEAEWERAARGGHEDARYPWGDSSPSQRPYAGYDVTTGGPARVGANEPNGFGLYDLSEGVHEWCSDYYDPGYYHRSPARNPPGALSGTRRVSRGGSWRHRVKFSRCAARSSLPPDFQYADYGFRLAMSPR